MNHTPKRLPIIIAGIALLLSGVASTLFIHSPVPDISRFGVSLGELRALSEGDPSSFPVGIMGFNVSDGSLLPGLATAGYFGPQPMACFAWEIRYGKEPHRNVVVDTGQDRTHLAEIPAKAVFHDADYSRMQDAMRNALAILLTHEHFDHSGGAARSPFIEEILPKLMLTPVQKASSLMDAARFPPGALEKTQALEYDRLIKISPGIVLVKTPGHTPGSQSVYVKTASGREYLIAGDIAWNMRNVETGRGRPLLTGLLLSERQDDTAHLLRWMKDLEERGVIILLSHDGESNQAYAKAGIIDRASP